MRLAPHTETPIDGLPPRIVPLRWIPEQEIHALMMVMELPFSMESAPTPLEPNVKQAET